MNAGDTIQPLTTLKTQGDPFKQVSLEAATLFHRCCHPVPPAEANCCQARLSQIFTCDSVFDLKKHRKVTKS